MIKLIKSSLLEYILMYLASVFHLVSIHVLPDVVNATFYKTIKLNRPKNYYIK